MHILVVNDDGPPSNQSSPYVHSLITTLQSAGHTVSVVLPHVQRSWIGKAHMVGQTLTATYFRPGTLHKDDGITSSGPFNDGGEEWILIDGTPASCTQIGLHHFFKERGPIDLVLSGPNYGRNTTALFALSSGTIGGAMEGAVCGMRSIALSYAFDSREHNPEWIAGASRISTRLIEKFVKEWPEDVDLFSINVPLQKDAECAKIVYCEMLQNQWKRGSSYQKMTVNEEDDTEPARDEQEIREGSEANGDASRQTPRRQQLKFKWAPNFADVRESIQGAKSGDGWAVLQGHISVTPLRANFWHAPDFKGEIKLNDSINDSNRLSGPTAFAFSAVVDYPDQYVQPLILRALQKTQSLSGQIIGTVGHLKTPSAPLLQIAAYEAIDFDHVLNHPQTSLACAYVIRKALIRKHYLSNTISSWLIKHPESILGRHFKSCVHFELDYAEFLDEALVDAWDLNESLELNASKSDAEEKEWWILKPGMSDGGNGIRLFSSLDDLTAIFEGWELENEEAEKDTDGEGEDEEDNDEGEGKGSGATIKENEVSNTPLSTSDESGSGVMTSQLRHFIAQPYIDPPLLLQSVDNRKFHIRTYVLAVGALKVYVYREMLALFAAKPYQSPSDGPGHDQLDLAHHLTNTCFQDEPTREGSVRRFWSLDGASLTESWKQQIFDQICEITGEVFEAATREQMVHFQAIPNAFEIFGVDFMVDKELNVWLLELNAYPDFKQTGQELQDIVVGGLFEEVIEVAVKPFFDQRRGHAGTNGMRLVRDIDIGRR